MSGLGIALQLVPLNSVGRPPSPVITISSPLLWQVWDRLAASLELASPGRLWRRENKLIKAHGPRKKSTPPRPSFYTWGN